MARNRSAARLVRLSVLEPDPAKAGIPVDDKPNPFQDGTDDPDVCLRGPWLDLAVFGPGDGLNDPERAQSVRGSGSASPA